MRSLGIAGVLAALTVASSAWAGDPGAALDELKKGYALKQEGKCVDAIPHFIESHRLDAQPKALLNLADCEEQLGDLVGAQKHAATARELALKQSNAELVSVADERLAALEKRVPRCTIRLAADAPPSTTVLLDGAGIPSTSLGVALAMNPGSHDVVVRAPARAEKRFAVKLAEGAKQELEVTPGAWLEGESLPPPASAPSGSSSRRWVAIGLGGVGVVGIGIGTFFGIQAISRKNDSNADGHCDGGCDPTGVRLRNEARSDATISTVSIVLGLAALAGGVTLYATEPEDRKTQGVRLGVRPTMGRDGGTLMLHGSWW